jgi:hypothetical protein
MQNHWVKGLGVALCVCAAGLSTNARAASTNKIISKLTPDEIVSRVITRAQYVHKLNRQTNYVYEKTSTTEELDTKGRVRNRKEKLLHYDSGVATLKQLKVNGEAVPERELTKQEAKSAAERQQVSGGHASRRDDNWNKYLNKDLTSRFTFELVGQEDIAGRPAYVLTFEPKSDKLPVKQMTDRLINRIAGKVWIDTREFEVAKAEIGLLDEVTMWGGLLGAMKKFWFDVERTRVDDVWFNRVSNFEMEARKLFDNTRVRNRSESGNFRKPVALNK